MGMLWRFGLRCWRDEDVAMLIFVGETPTKGLGVLFEDIVGMRI